MAAYASTRWPYDIIATRTGPQAVSTILPSAYGHGVAESRQLTLRFLLNRTKRGGDVSRAGTSAKDDDRVHPQDITPEQDADGVRENGDDQADKHEAEPGFLQPRKEAGPGCQSHAGHEDRTRPTVSKIHMADSGMRPKVG